ncbi:DUF2817 domain-containing protein [Noviherbaspirillum sp. UKPF54]|uniref:DUF2817 domain-containing protein n=1 Tax=Noviherbaspirillum sp. UKPF54 TaxID=2601898 RepID=UPI00143CF434|nr:DUF2817 domain-containing protein [Noviherbaspirillum sp. UKPF54]
MDEAGAPQAASRTENAPALSLPGSYLESRDRFRELGARIGADLRAFRHDEAQGATPPLFTDTAYLGAADAPVLVVIASGTHGVEGYAGAACQFRFMQDYPARHARSGFAYLLVHAVNPWGFFHDRRVTPEGIDLNRNFVDFPVTREAGAAYAAYHDLLLTRFRPLPRGWWNEIRLLSHALTRTRRKTLQAAITAGQYAYPDGLFFGGAAPARSRLVWEEIVNTFARGRRRALLLDLHTGLGKRGAGELISYLPPDAADFRKMARWFDGGIRSMAGGDSVSAALKGDLTAAFDHAVGGQSYALGLEFGTCAPLAVLNALRTDHWYHNNAHRLPPPERERARRKMKAAFAGADRAWCDRVAARFDQVLAQLVRGLGAD